jgi:hypothetical protein
MSARRALLLALACAAVACAEPWRGGYTTRDQPASNVRTLATFVPGHCEDAAHADLPPRIASVELVETATGRTLLFEHRQGHELLVAENHFDDRAYWVFQVLLGAENRLREWRIPRSDGATGTLLVGKARSAAGPGQHFQAKLAAVDLSCSLVSSSSDLPRGSTNLVP